MANWDKRYAEASARLFGGSPNEYLRQVMARSDVAPKSALCLADGDGRNGAWLAGQGLAVTAIDISEVATAQAATHDRALGVEVERITADLATWAPEPGRTWDVVFLMYLQCEAAIRSRAAAIGASVLSAGGWLAAEGFAADDTGRGELGPDDRDLLYDLNDLIGAMESLAVIEAFTGWTKLNEGVKHQGTGCVVRLLTRKV